MNKQKEITSAKVRTLALTLLGIVASVGLWNLIVAKTWNTATQECLTQATALEASNSLLLTFHAPRCYTRREYKPSREEQVLDIFLEIGERNENPTLEELLQTISEKTPETKP